MRHSPEEPESKSYITFSNKDTADDDFMIEWLLLAARLPRPRRSAKRATCPGTMLLWTVKREFALGS